MEEERAVHPIVPNKSLDFEGFTLREQNAICRRLRQRLPGMATLQPAPGFSVHAQYVMTATKHHCVRSVTFRSRKVYWGRKHIRTI
jgi:hypothetical protein